MNVTRSNIDATADEFRSLVSSASFVAMDLEMTGISLPDNDCKESLMDTPSMRYSKMRKVASRFNVVQVGLTLFHEKNDATNANDDSTCTDDADVDADVDADADVNNASPVLSEDRFEARTYNVFTFPAKGQITLDSSAVDFLVKNGMDWNAWFQDGVSYLRKGPADKLKQRMFPTIDTIDDASKATSTSTSNGNGDGNGNAGKSTFSPNKKKNTNAMVLDKAEDITFCNEALVQVAEWHAEQVLAMSMEQGESESDNIEITGTATANEHMLPSCNSYRRRFLYQELERIYGTGLDDSLFSIETRTPDPNRHWEKQMVIFHLTPEQRLVKEAAALASKQKIYNERIGFRRMWTALTESNKPLVVHNGLFDLLFMVQHMHDDLPETLGEFKNTVGGLFPGGVFDTRMVGGGLFVEDNVNVEKRSVFSDLRLDKIYGVCKSESDAAAVDTNSNHKCAKPKIHVTFAEGHDRYEDPSKACLHEAGYDSYITAFSFAYMRKMALVDHLNGSKYRMPLYRSFYNGVDLTPNSNDIVSEMDQQQQHVFKGFPKEYQTSDVIRLFTCAPYRKDGTGAKEGEGEGNGVEEKKKSIRVFVRWINDDSVVVRFANDDADIVRANLDAHIHIAASAKEGLTNHMMLVPLDAYMRASDEKVAASGDTTAATAAAEVMINGNGNGGDGSKRGIKRKAAEFVSSSAKRVRAIIQGCISKGGD